MRMIVPALAAVLALGAIGPTALAQDAAKAAQTAERVGIDTGVPVSEWWRMLRFWRELEDAIEVKKTS